MEHKIVISENYAVIMILFIFDFSIFPCESTLCYHKTIISKGYIFVNDTYKKYVYNIVII